MRAGAKLAARVEAVGRVVQARVVGRVEKARGSEWEQRATTAVIHAAVSSMA